MERHSCSHPINVYGASATNQPSCLPSFCVKHSEDMVSLKAVVVNVIMCEVISVSGKMAESQALLPDSGPVSVSEAEEMMLQLPWLTLESVGPMSLLLFPCL